MGQGLEAARKAARRAKQRETYDPNTSLEDYGSQTTTSVGLTPFIRENDINFAAKNLKPDTAANFFFDEIKVNNFAQRASYINVSSNSVLTKVSINEGVYGETSKAYAEVLGTSLTSNKNLVYLNENYLSLEIKNGVGAPNLTSNEYELNDLVYQTDDDQFTDFNFYTGLTQPNFTFLGRVKKLILNSPPTSATLIVDPILGRANTTTTEPNSDNLFNLTKFNPNNRYVNDVKANNKFVAGETLRYAANNGEIGTVSTANSYVALSSVVSGANTVNLKSVVISSNNISRDGISDIVGKTMYIVSGTNMGFSSTIAAVSANTLTGWNEAILNDVMPFVPTSNTVYSIGEHSVDDVGALYGIMHIPSADNLRWLSGERLFTITDTATYNDNAYNMRAIGKYNAVGKINSQENARNVVLREQTPNTLQAAPKVTDDTQKINDRKFMAQTFFTPKPTEIVNGQVKNSYGMFVSSVDLYFKNKPTDSEEQFSFTVAISKVENGLPANDIIAERTLECGYINVSANTPRYGNTSAITKFAFKDPVYLLPGTEYAIKLITESPDYQVWTSTVGQQYVDENGNSRTVSEQPYVGNFFTSQNASNWNPILNQDLMFAINRASFSTTSKTISFYPIAYLNNEVGSGLFNGTVFDEVKISSTEQQFSPTSIKYEFSSLLTDGTTVVDFITLNNNEIYKFGKDTNISSVFAKRRRFIPRANTQSVNVKVTLLTTDDSVSPIINRERFSLHTLQNIINNGGISNNFISVVDGGSHSNASNIVVTISNPDVGGDVALANVLPSMLVGGKLKDINITKAGSGYFTNPTITISEPGAAVNARAIINGETDISGGNNLARYITKIVELESGLDAGDLIVKMNAIKPQGTNIQVYFKILSGLDPDSFANKKWQRMIVLKDNISPDQVKLVPLEYRYESKKGQIEYFEGDKSYPLGGSFKYFAVKIVMTASDPTVVPMIEDLRIVAVPGEIPITNDVDAGFYS